MATLKLDNLNIIVLSWVLLTLQRQPSETRPESALRFWDHESMLDFQLL